MSSETSESRNERRHGYFDPDPHETELRSIIEAIEALPAESGEAVDRAKLDAILRAYPRAGSGFFSRSQLIAGYRHFADRWGLEGSAEAFARRVKRRPVRTQSGVTPITVLTKPYPCPGKCVFCPNDVRMPKSYLSDEPGAQRAAMNQFDPYLQTWNRLKALDAIGHPTDKIELIALGGTWSFYPESYQVWFATRCFEAMNDFGCGTDACERATPATPDFTRLPKHVDGREHLRNPYNRVVTKFLAQSLDRKLVAEGETASWDTLVEAQRCNEENRCRNVGFSVETRPDCVTQAEVLRLRRLGCTKIQIGIQSLSDEVLGANRRGHGVSETRDAIALLRGTGFKIHAHWMPNLLGSTPERDANDFARLFDEPDFRPDELKVYPCSLIESAELMQHYERGEWRPYEFDELESVLHAVFDRVPRYCRLTRVIRDISSDDIVAGNMLTNFREIAERSHKQRGGRTLDIRSREIRSESIEREDLTLQTTRFSTSIGEERFLEFTTSNDQIAGFLRLSLPTAEAPIDEIEAAAVIREVHVYGPAKAIGSRSTENAQHRGLGSELVAEAARQATEVGYPTLVVISAIGTRPYYRKLGFTDGPLYQHKKLNPTP